MRVVPTGFCLGGARLGSEGTTMKARPLLTKQRKYGQKWVAHSFCKRIIQGQWHQETHIYYGARERISSKGPTDTLISVTSGLCLGAHWARMSLSFQM